MKKDCQTKAASAATAEFVMPERVSVAMAELTENVKEGLLPLAVGTGLRVMHVLMAKLSTRRYAAGLEPVGTAVVQAEWGAVPVDGRRQLLVEADLGGPAQPVGDLLVEASR